MFSRGQNRRDRSQAEIETFPRLRWEWWRLVIRAASAARVLASRWTHRTGSRKTLLIVLLPDESFQRRVHLINIERNCRFRIAWVIDFIRRNIAIASHTLIEDQKGDLMEREMGH